MYFKSLPERIRINRAVSSCRIALLAIVALTLGLTATASASSLYGPQASASTEGTVDASNYPWSTIGRLNIAGHSYCTGVMIGERHLLTQAHCLFNKTENRWWDASDLHYRAGYQHDSHITASAVYRFEVSGDYDPLNPKSLASVANDWALVTLERPLGEITGWLAVQKLDERLRDKLQRGRAKLFSAGYHKGWEHAIRVSQSCGSESTNAELPGVRDVPCRKLLISQHSLPRFYYENGEYKLVASEVFSSHDRAERRDSWTFASLKKAKRSWGESQAPQ